MAQACTVAPVVIVIAARPSLLGGKNGWPKSQSGISKLFSINFRGFNHSTILYYDWLVTWYSRGRWDERDGTVTSLTMFREIDSEYPASSESATYDRCPSSNQP
jgi:hypothetical protein